MSELQVRPKITILGQDEHETDTENRTSTNSTSDLTNPLEMVKKTCQALEFLNSDVRARSQAQITILGQDEHETDTENQTSTNSASDLTKPLEMVKKTYQALELLNSDVRARSQAQITILGQHEHETNTENLTSKNSASYLTNPLEMVKKTCHALELLNSEVRARSQAQITILGQDEHETDTENRTSTNSVSDLKNPS